MNKQLAAEIADRIVNHFMKKGARVDHGDFKYVRQLVKKPSKHIDNCGHEMKYNYDTETDQGTDCTPVDCYYCRMNAQGKPCQDHEGGRQTAPTPETDCSTDPINMIQCCCLIDNHCEHCPNYGIEDREAVDDTCYDEDCPMSYKYHSTKEYSCESNSPAKPNSSEVFGIDRDKLERAMHEMDFAWHANKKQTTHAQILQEVFACLVPVPKQKHHVQCDCDDCWPVEDRVEEMITEVGAFEPRLPGWEKVIEELMNEYVTKTQSEYQEKLLHFERFYKEYAKTQYEAGIYDERERWINQPANEHDNKIRNEAYEKAAMLAFHELVKPCGTTMANTVANHIRNLKKQKR